MQIFRPGGQIIARLSKIVYLDGTKLLSILPTLHNQMKYGTRHPWSP